MRPLAERTDVLIVCEHFAPAVRAGGGARSLNNVVDRLGDRFRFAVVTRDHDVGDSEPFTDPPSGEWVTLGKARVHYSADRDLSFRQLLRRVAESDPSALYLSSLFSGLAIRILLLRRLGLLAGRSVIVAPHGELSRGALATRKLRKHLYLRVALLAGLFRDVLWHATSEPEAERIRDWFGAEQPVRVALNLLSAEVKGGPSPPSPGHPRPRERELELIFFSRLDPKKNLLFLLEALRRTGRPVHVGIAGTIADRRHWRRCEQALARLPPNVRVTVHGAIHPDRVSDLLSQSAIFAFPTLGENFGYVILEALAAGCFVLVSPHTPWADLETEQVGRILEISDPELWREEIERLADWPEPELERRRELARRYAQRHLASEEPVRQLERLFSAALSLSAGA